MRKKSALTIHSVLQLYELLPENERLITDMLRQLVSENLPGYCREKISFKVPYFYGKRGICIIWPATIKGGGIREGVLLGFWQGYRIKDPDNFLTRGNNRKVFYKIFYSVEEIDPLPILNLLAEAVKIDSESGK